MPPGSSPRARGTRADLWRQTLRRRFIPACAGNAHSGHVLVGATPVHPRVRGERSRVVVVGLAACGSSPRARGTPMLDQMCNRLRRFIPACAGSARRAGRSCGRAPVHPRVRGERAAGVDSPHDPHGSSPRARGTHAHQFSRGIVCRFIPACAGNAAGLTLPAFPVAVHPRVRGERTILWRHATDGGGSSPRARGTRQFAIGRLGEGRFIPACAGNAGKRCWFASSHAVHPRVRGERPDPHMRDTVAGGSSPRARGTQAS